MYKSAFIFLSLFFLVNNIETDNPRIIDIKIYTHYPFNLLTWTIPKNINDSFFQVERSYDSVNFINIGKSSSSGMYWNFKTYEYSDLDTNRNTKYYRLVLIKPENDTFYFKEKTIKSK